MAAKATSLPGLATVRSASERMLPPTVPVKRAFSSPTPESPAEVSNTNDAQESFVQRFVPDMVVERLFNGGAIQAQELSRVRFFIIWIQLQY